MSFYAYTSNVKSHKEEKDKAASQTENRFSRSCVHRWRLRRPVLQMPFTRHGPGLGVFLHSEGGPRTYPVRQGTEVFPSVHHLVSSSLLGLSLWTQKNKYSGSDDVRHDIQNVLEFSVFIILKFLDEWGSSSSEHIVTYFLHKEYFYKLSK